MNKILHVFTYPFFLPFFDFELTNTVLATSASILLASPDLDVISSDSIIIVRLVASFALCFCLITLAKKLSSLSSSDKSIGGERLFQNTFVFTPDAFVLEGSDCLRGIFPRLDKEWCLFKSTKIKISIPPNYKLWFTGIKLTLTFLELCYLNHVRVRSLVLDCIRGYYEQFQCHLYCHTLLATNLWKIIWTVES